MASVTTPIFVPALIDHDLRFENDYLAANQSFVISHVDAQGRLLPRLYTKTGYVENHFSVGPAILWAPVMLAVHGTVLLADHFGAHVAADGYSRPYLLAMALTTACYGFLSLFLAFRIARKYFDDQWAFLATVGIWMASSLPIYMYFNPSWSHAHFRVYRCAVSLVLGTNKIAANGRAMGHFGIDGRLDGKCLLSECYSVDISRAGSRSSLCARNSAMSGQHHCPNSKIDAQVRRISRGLLSLRFSPLLLRGRSSTEVRLKPAIRQFRLGIGLLPRCSRFCFLPITECLAGLRS